MSKLVAVDTETNGLRPWHGDMPFAVGFCWEDGSTEYYDFPVDPFTRKVDYWGRDNCNWERCFEILTDESITKVFHNGKFDIRHIELGMRIAVKGRCEETLFAAHACNNLETTFKLKVLADKYLKIPADDEKDLKRATMRARLQAKKLGYQIAKDLEADYWLPKIFDPDNQLCQIYCEKDTVRTMLLWLMYKEWMEELDVRFVYEREIALAPVTYAMETRGVELNRNILDQQITLAHRELAMRQENLNRLAEREFNPNSNEQLADLLYHKFGLECKERTSKGKPSTDTKALESHARHPFVMELVKFRSAEKSLASFFEKYRDNALWEKGSNRGTLHPNFNQVGPVTGRYSCREPNLQNVANALTTRSSEPIQARTSFTPREGWIWYHFDYSQLEVRIFAGVAKEKTMLAAIDSGRDLHTECANKAWGGVENPAAWRAARHALEFHEPEPSTADIKAVWKELGWPGKTSFPENMPVLEQMQIANDCAQRWLAGFNGDAVAAEASFKKKTSRAKAKMVLFAKIFGGGANAIKDLLYCTEEEARQFLSEYDAAFPDIVNYIKGLSRQAQVEGGIRNCWGRWLRVDPDKSYRAVNYMVQGSAADLLKSVMLRNEKWVHGLRYRGKPLDAFQVLTIHDESVWEIRIEQSFKWLLRGIKQIMEDHEGHLPVECPVEIAKTTSRWDKKEAVDV